MPADLIFTGGPVFTGRRHASGEWETARAAAVRGDRILAVGTEADVLAHKGARTELVDLRGRTLMCGFIDAHLHLATHGTNQMGVCCKYPEVRSLTDIQSRIAARAAQQPRGTWVRGWGYNQMKLAERRHPTRWDLDQAAPDHPVVLLRTDYHTAVFNSAALRRLGIQDDDPDPPGGEYERAGGVVTGVSKELAYMAHADTCGYSDAELVEGVDLASRDLVRRGVTSVHDMGGPGPRNFRAFQQAIRAGKCDVRIWAVLWSFYGDAELHQAIFGTGLLDGFGDQRLKLGSFKIMIDGSSSGPTAATRQPYAVDPAQSGILHMPPEVVVERIVAAHARGFNCTAHAVGDRAIDILLTAYEEAQRRHPRPGARHRIEHCVMAAPDLRARMKQLGVVPVPQPTWFYEFGDGYLKSYGEERVACFKPLRSWLDEGFIPALSTDCPVTYPDPFLNLYTALTRETAAGAVAPGREQVTLAEALWMYTYGGAYAAGEEAEKGTVQPGRLADLIVLDRDIFGARGAELKQVQVDLTLVGGRVVHAR